MTRISKTIVCLANSRKLSGRCIAGKELLGGSPGGWIRPVSAREHEEVSEHERQYVDGSDPQVRDILRVPLLQARPRQYQQENWLLDPNHYWEKEGRATWADLARLVDPVQPLWTNDHRTANGLHDQIPLSLAAILTSSLRFVHVDVLTVVVFSTGEAFGNPKRRVQGRFQHAGTEYRLWITDPDYERRYFAGPDGEFQIGESFLTISVGEPFRDHCYKLIAAIIERNREARA